MAGSKVTLSTLERLSKGIDRGARRLVRSADALRRAASLFEDIACEVHLVARKLARPRRFRVGGPWSSMTPEKRQEVQEELKQFLERARQQGDGIEG
jgi:coenzyme F420-reducing hydrogenase alpha subunit